MALIESETMDFDGPVPGGNAVPVSTGDVLSGRYRLDEEIGRGGMGVVFRAWDSDLERNVAVKIVAAHLGSGDARDRLFAEARAAAALSHPRVVAVHDVGEHDSMPYFVMELVEGPNLGRRKPESLEETISVATQICEALGHAHGHGLVHRDLKPANVLLTNRSGEPSIKLVDLGLAVRRDGIRMTRDGAISGTVAYMAPEQALGKELDGRADLYALGVMLYEFATGRLPFDGDNPLAVLSQHLHAPVVPPRTYRPDIPDVLEDVILRLLAKDPDDRFATAAEVAEFLTRAEVAAPAPSADRSPAILGGLVRGRLVGRDREIDALRRAWSEAAAGRGGMVLVSGEPGSGKTRLARELVDYARITGGTVLAGGCYELEAATPYLPFVEALRAWVHGRSDDELRQATQTAAAELARLAPELEDRIGPFPDGPSLSAAERRLRLFDGVARFLADLADPGGLLVFVDDLQWADQASLSLLHYLVRLIGRERVLIVGCYRETELDRSHPLAEALDQWNRQRTAVRIRLGRLDHGGTAALLAALLGDDCLSDEFCADIHHETEGNPFFIEEVVKTLVEEEQIVCECGEWKRRDEGAGLVLPQGVKAAIGRRLDRVSGTTTDVLRTAAILGKTFEFSELVAVAEPSEDELLDAIDEAVAAQLLETGAGEAVAFTHDKIREVLYHELNPIRRRRLHSRIVDGLEALRGRGGRVTAEDLAHHSIEGGCLDKGFEYAVEAAADAANLFAYGDSLRLYERARECAEALGRTDQLPRIDTAVGDVFALKGEPLNAAEAYERALSAAQSDEEATRLRCKIGESYVLVGDDRALKFISEARTSLDPSTQPAEVARATMIEARFHHYRGHSAEAAERLLQALEPAERAGETQLLGWIYGYLAGAYQHLTDFEESTRWARRCIELGRAHDNPNIESIGFEFFMENAFSQGEWRATLEHAERHRELAEKASSVDRMAWNRLGHGSAKYGLGELTEAEQSLDAGLELADRLGDSRLAIFLENWRAHTLADLGRIDEAIALADRLIEQADELGLKAGQEVARQARAYVALLAGDYDSILELADQFDALTDDSDEAGHPIWIGPTICQALVETRRFDEAECRLGTILEAARRSRMVHWEATALRVRGQLHAMRGDIDAAIEDVGASIEILEKTESRVELARSLVVRAQLSGASEEDIERARALFDACGAALDLERLGSNTRPTQRSE